MEENVKIKAVQRIHRGGGNARGLARSGKEKGRSENQSSYKMAS